MSAQSVLQAALVAALSGIEGITGVFDGPPEDQALPYVSVEGGSTIDWSHKTARGREHRIGVTVFEEAGRATRLRGILDAATEAIEALPADLDGHRVASVVFVRERIVRGAGPWAGVLEYRVRTLEI